MHKIYLRALLSMLVVAALAFLFQATPPKSPPIQGDPSRRCGAIYIDIKGTQYPVYKDGVKLAYCKGDTALTAAKP